MSIRTHEDAHGLTPRESAMIDRLEAGDDHGDVAAMFGVTRATIDMMANRYIITVDQLTRFDRMVRRGDAIFQQALAASGGRFA